MASQSLPRILATDEIVPTLTRHIDAHRKLVDIITDKIDVSSACFDNIIKPLVELENEQAGEKAIIDALKYCSPSQECQQAVDEGQALWQEYNSNKRRDLYNLINAARDASEDLDVESQRLIDRMLLEYQELGYDSLDDEGIRRRRQRTNKIEELCAQFHRNLREYKGGEWLTPEELDGLPIKDIEVTGLEGKGFYNHNSKHFTIMKNCRNEETRKRWLLGRSQRHIKNVPIFREVILLRSENARELGFTSHAATRLPYRIAQSTEWVDDLVDQLTQLLLPLGKVEFKRLDDRRKQWLSDSLIKSDEIDSKFMSWDFIYYNSMLNQESQVDHAAIADYFPLKHTVGAMLEIFSDCLQLRFEPLTQAELTSSIWHDDIEGWRVVDERDDSKGEFIGFLFADLLSRPNKYKGNQSVNLQPGYLKPNGERVYPANTLMCNFQNTSPTTGCLLNHSTVSTLFHELGHSIHDLVSRTRYARFHGFQVALELGEGIGIMLENWCWIPDELKALSRHYTRVDPAYMEAWKKDHPESVVPPEKIPDELLQQRFARRGYAKVGALLNILIHTCFDMAVHNPASHESLLELNEVEAFKEIHEKLQFFPLPDPSYQHVTYGHLLAGYDAGYYSYVCAELIGASIFQLTFTKSPRSQVAWERFRREILEYGGSRNELEILEGYLGGHPANPDKLLAMLGMSAGMHPVPHPSKS